MTEPSASVVICTHTMARWDALVSSVRSVLEQVPRPAEVVVVVDHAADVAARARAELAGVTVVENTRRRGLAGARNTGVDAVAGDVVVFLDDDARAAPGWLAALLTPYADPRVAGVGGAVLADWERSRPRWFPAEFEWVVGCTYTGMPETGGPVRNPIGANMSFRRSALVAAGPFCEDLGRIGSTPLGCEETEFCVRLRQRDPGAVLLYEPSARVHHLVPPNRATVRYFRSRCWAEGLSKASVVRRAGRRDGLSAERTYTVRTLPAAAARGLADAVVRGDASGLGRSLAVTGGLFITAGGFAAGRIRGGSRAAA